LRKLTHEKYREKEVQFPVLAGLLHFTIRDAQGKRYDREGLTAWARERFGVDFTLEDLKNKQRAEIEEAMFAQSQIASEKTPETYKELREKLDNVLRAGGFDPVAIRTANETAGQVKAGQQHSGSRFAARSMAKQTTRYTGKYATGKSRSERDVEDKKQNLDKNLPELIPFCEWVSTELQTELTPGQVSQWDIHELEDRLSSLAEDRFNPEMRKMERSLVLQILDTVWKEHLQVIDQLRSSIGLRGYAQVDPKVEFKREGMRIFNDMWDLIYQRVTDLIFRMEQFDPDFISSTWNETSATHANADDAVRIEVHVQQNQQQPQDINDGSEPVKVETIHRIGPKIGRNEPCPCGSGKKYKHCHLRKNQ
jgi:preprotein translocase subunit SecA